MSARAPVRAMEYVTVPGVEIAYAGMNWPASTGPVTLTVEHLADAVRAANGDPHIVAPRLKLGHTDQRFETGEDGQPAFGRVVNLRLENDGASLVGDYVEVPAWLAQALPSAYPSRSIEGDWNIETEGGKRYSFVVTAVALLGERLPGITNLEDLERLLVDGPAAVTAAGAEAGKETGMTVALEASFDGVLDQFCDDYCTDGRYWWWPVDLRVDEGVIWADDDEGHLFRVPFTVDDNGVAAFGDPVRGVVVFKDTPGAPDDMDEAGDGGQMAAVRLSLPARPRPTDRVRATTTKGGPRMGLLDTLRERFHLADDATEDAILAKVDEAIPAPTPPAATPTPVAAAAETDDDTTVTVSREIWDETNARLGRLETVTKAREERETGIRRDGLVADAVRASKITPAEVDHYRSMMEVDEEKTLAALDKLAPGRIPVAGRERGTASTGGASEQELLTLALSAMGVNRNGRES